MPVIGGAKGLIDLAGFDRIAVVTADRQESVRLRGSAARRLVQHLLDQRGVDHTLPALCSPPPSDLDLLFSSDDSERIEAMLRDIRNSAPIFQAIRVEASSLPRIQSLADEVESYIDCPAFGVSIGDIDEEGFQDSSGRGIQQLADRRLTFHLTPDASSEALDQEVQFHLYCAGLVFAKAAHEHGSIEDFLDSAAHEYCRSRVALARAMATPPKSGVTEETAYYRARLYGIAFSLRAIWPWRMFLLHIVPLLPRRIAGVVVGSGPSAAMFNLAKSEIFESEDGWVRTLQESIRDDVDLAQAEPLFSSPSISLLPGMVESCFLECLVPVIGDFRALGELPAGGPAAIELSIWRRNTREIIWLPASCGIHVRDHVAAVRVPLTQAAAIVDGANDLLGEVEGEAVVHVLRTQEEAFGAEDARLTDLIDPDDDEREKPHRTMAQFEGEM